MVLLLKTDTYDVFISPATGLDFNVMGLTSGWARR